MCRLLSSVLPPEILEYSRWRTEVFSLKYWSTLAGVLTLSINYAESTIVRISSNEFGKSLAYSSPLRLSPRNYSRSGIKKTSFFVFHSLIRNFDLKLEN